MKPPHLKSVDQPSCRRMEDLSDDELMLLVKADRQDAFAALARRYQQLVLGLSTRFLNDSALGRDVVQDVYLSLWAERERYQPCGFFRNYLVSVTIHRCHVVARQLKNYRKKLSNLEHSLPEPKQDLPVDKLVEREQARQIRRKLVRLPEKMRKVLILRFTSSFTLDEIAESTGLPLGTVKSHVSRGLKRLYRMLSGEVL